jgi:hypothetical protein
MCFAGCVFSPGACLASTVALSACRLAACATCRISNLTRNVLMRQGSSACVRNLKVIRWRLVVPGEVTAQCAINLLVPCVYGRRDARAPNPIEHRTLCRC